MKTRRWEKIPHNKYAIAEQFLRANEKKFVSASARFLQFRKKSDEIWVLKNPEINNYSDKTFELRSFKAMPFRAMLLHSHQTIYPLFCGNSDIPLPSFLGRILLRVYVHSLHGPAEDVEILENLMKTRSYIPSDRVLYDLMETDQMPPALCQNYGPIDLILRPPEKSDTNKIYELQAAYEQEEVLPKGADFFPASCRANLEHLLKTEKMLLACLGNEIVGKINTNAKSFSRYQIGGVYVRPGFRGRGIASRMTAVFVESLIRESSAVSLFVKKANAGARTVYGRSGFKSCGNYRISYF